MPLWKFQDNPRERFHAQCVPFKDALKKLDKALLKMNGEHCSNPIHLCFTCDPYPANLAPDDDITRKALMMLHEYRMENVQILTKGGMRAVRDFDLFERNPGWKFGSTVVAVNDEYYYLWDNHGLNQDGWEPGTDSMFQDREAAIQFAHSYGIYTWVSLEPVVNVREALTVIDRLRPWVNFWKIGKLNHGKEISPEMEEIEKSTDWASCVQEVKRMLKPGEYMLKKSLKECDHA